MNQRLPGLKPSDLDDEQGALYEAITGGPRAARSPFQLADAEGRLAGPFNAMLLSPAVGFPLQELGAAIRYRTSLTDREREIAILALAVERRCEFEWYAHELIAQQIGFVSDELAALGDGRCPDTCTDAERLIHTVTLAMLRERDLGDELFSTSQQELGMVKLAELVTLVGYYDQLALSLKVWRTPLPAGASPRFT